MENLEISFCPYRTGIDNTWSTIQTTQHDKPLTFSGTVQTTQYTEPVFFGGTAKGLELLEANKEKHGDPTTANSKYISIMAWNVANWE
jgi:hypothetical protein